SAFYPSQLPQSIGKSRTQRGHFATCAQNAHGIFLFGLLRPCRHRPCSRAAEQRDELAPLHSITSSARASSAGGISRSFVLGVCRLMTNSNLVALSTGRSAGFSPLRMRPV